MIVNNEINSIVASLTLKEKDSESSRVNVLYIVIEDDSRDCNLAIRQTQWENQHEKAFGELKESLDEVRRFDRGKSVKGQDGSGEI
ncbi:hypothetical protein H5410_006650 [Solanum commersonii]|uniref:Uncharacterized protein n=1 Tax=Solanum commersonii TaxID=4109 RepID=A0A9J6AAE6_SOLCO|nr:hypothetical protein H5410_006650 [Solanum commersonii]